MADIKVTIVNAEAIKATFQKYPREMSTELHSAIGKSIKQVQSKAMREAPVNKQSGGGNLRQSIRASMTGALSGVVEVGVQYATYVHDGTRPHIIEVRNKKVLANSRTGQVFGRKVNHPGTRANPFLQRAVDQAKPDIDRYFIQAVQKVFN